MKQSNPAHGQLMHRALTDARGAIYLEYLMMGMLQLTLWSFSIQALQLYEGRIAVDYAAIAAAQKAAQVLSQCAKNFDHEEPVYQIDYNGTPPDEDPLLKRLSQEGLLTGSHQIVNGSGGHRLQAIRTAAYIRLLAAAPEPNDIAVQTSWRSAIGGAPEERIEFGATIYNRVASAITFQGHEGKRTITFGMHESPVVRVTYLVPCTVPLISNLMCSDWRSVQSQVPDAQLDALEEAQASGDAERIQAAMGHVRSAQQRLQQDAEEWNALDYAEAPWARWLFESSTRFMPMSAEHSLPIDGRPKSSCTEEET